MKLFLALCFVAAVAQAYNVDWDIVSTADVFPEGLLEQIAESGLTPENVPEDDLSRIVNGEEATPGQFPYQVGLFSWVGDAAFFCGGSILNNEWILTAAHCVDVADSVDVVFSAHNIREDEEEQFTVKVSETIVHPQWNPSTITNDIAVLKLATPVAYSARVQPTRLPSRSQVGNAFVGETATVSGWGKDSDSAAGITTILRHTSNPILRNTRCNLYYFGAISGNQVCLSGSGRRSSCNGDSGGPLVITDSDGEITQIGIVSFGIALGCAVGWPGVYVRTTQFLDWIETNTNGDIVIRS